VGEEGEEDAGLPWDAAFLGDVCNDGGVRARACHGRNYRGCCKRIARGDHVERVPNQ